MPRVCLRSGAAGCSRTGPRRSLVPSGRHSLGPRWRLRPRRHTVSSPATGTPMPSGASQLRHWRLRSLPLLRRCVAATARSSGRPRASRAPCAYRSAPASSGRVQRCRRRAASGQVGARAQSAPVARLPRCPCPGASQTRPTPSRQRRRRRFGRRVAPTGNLRRQAEPPIGCGVCLARRLRRGAASLAPGPAWSTESPADRRLLCPGPGSAARAGRLRRAAEPLRDLPLTRPSTIMQTQTPAPRSATPSSGSPAPGSLGLSVDDRRHLLAWLDKARVGGIDATEDLRMRPWPMPVTAQVIGVFRTGMTMATWLVVGQNDLWTVVSVAESTVLATRPSLAAALAIIHSPPGRRRRSAESRRRRNQAWHASRRCGRRNSGLTLAPRRGGPGGILNRRGDLNSIVMHR